MPEIQKLEPALVLHKVEVFDTFLYRIAAWKDGNTKRGTSGALFTSNGWTVASSSTPAFDPSSKCLWVWGTDATKDAKTIVIVVPDQAKKLEELVRAYNVWWLIQAGQLRLPIEDAVPESVAIRPSSIV